MQEDMGAVPGGQWGIGRKEGEASNPSIQTPTGYEAAMTGVVSQDIQTADGTCGGNDTRRLQQPPGQHQSARDKCDIGSVSSEESCQSWQIAARSCGVGDKPKQGG